LRGAAIDWTLAQYFSGIRGVMGRLSHMLGVDLPRMRARLDAARDSLFHRANVLSDGSWSPRPFGH